MANEEVVLLYQGRELMDDLGLEFFNQGSGTGGRACDAEAATFEVSAI